MPCMLILTKSLDLKKGFEYKEGGLNFFEHHNSCRSTIPVLVCTGTFLHHLISIPLLLLCHERARKAFLSLCQTSLKIIFSRWPLLKHHLPSEAYIPRASIQDSTLFHCFKENGRSGSFEEEFGVVGVASGLSPAWSSQCLPTTRSIHFTHPLRLSTGMLPAVCSSGINVKTG